MGILDDNNFVFGAFTKDGPKRNAEQRERSARRVAIAGIVFSVIWIFGLGSVLGILFGATARGDAESPTARRLSTAAITLGLIGFVFAIVPFFLK